MVRLPGLDRYLDSPVYLPVMSRFGAQYTAECYGYFAVGYVHQVESDPGKD